MSDSALVARPTPDSGVPIASDRHSLTVGSKAATMLHDVVQKMQHFNRERGVGRPSATHGFGTITMAAAS
jgi:catalase